MPSHTLRLHFYNFGTAIDALFLVSSLVVNAVAFKITALNVALELFCAEIYFFTTFWDDEGD